MPTVTFPKKYLRSDSGSIVLKLHTVAVLTDVFLFSSGNASLRYKNGAYELTINSKKLNLARESQTDYITVLWTWEKDEHALSVSDSQGIQTIRSPKEFSLFEPDTLTLVGEPIFKGTFVLIEMHVTSLLTLSGSQLNQTHNSYMHAIASGAINEGISNTYNHLYSDLLKVEGMLFGRDFRQTNIRYLQKPYLEATPAPQDASPILASDKTGPLRRHSFFNTETGVYTDTNTETFILKRENHFALSYDGINKKDPPLVYIKGERVPVLNIEGPLVYILLTKEEQDLWYGETVTITYKLDRSYYVEFNEEAAFDSYYVRLDDRQGEPVTITQEGNRHHTVKLATEIELNPIVSPQHTGFLYIDNEEQHTQAFRLNVSSTYLLADGMDSADFTVELIDQNGNEVLSPYIDVFVADKTMARQTRYGVLTPIITEDTLHARNRAGRCYYRYRAPLLKPEDLSENDTVFLVAFDRKSKLGAHLPLRLKTVTELKQGALPTILSEEGPQESMLPFEYFSRYYEKNYPLNHPIKALDKDEDGTLTRSDWLALQKDLQNISLFASLSEQLLEKEAF